MTSSAAADDPQKDERKPLVEAEASRSEAKSSRQALFDVLEGAGFVGGVYEFLTISVIIANAIAFVMGTLFLREYNENPPFECDDRCDLLWFGNYHMTSYLEVASVVFFTVDYVLRFMLADLESPAHYSGIMGRLRFLVSFFSLVDLCAIIPFYVDVMMPEQAMASWAFVRIFRLFRMMRVEGRYAMALTMLKEVFSKQSAILGTALFVGVTTWITVSCLYYIVEHRSTLMIYCPSCPDYDTSACTFDSWGFTHCPDDDECSTASEQCYNLFRSVPMASYYALLNLFGEFPLIDNHTAAGKVVGTIVAVVAVAVFALPAGIIGNGFEEVISNRSKSGSASGASKKEDPLKPPLAPSSQDTWRARWYNFLHVGDRLWSDFFDRFVMGLVLITAFTFMGETLPNVSPQLQITMDVIEMIAVSVFTFEYIAKVYSIAEHPVYSQPGGRLRYMTRFLPLVDLMSVLPYWIEVIITHGQIITPTAETSAGSWSAFVKCMRLLRLLRLDRFVHAFRSFGDVLKSSSDILAVTGYTALILWVFCSALLYFTERDNPNPEMAAAYNTVPQAMWITLLNLSGESPLSQYTKLGKIITGLIGLFATGLFGIPIGVLGAGFEELVEEREGEDEHVKNQSAEETKLRLSRVEASPSSSSFTASIYNFVNGTGSKVALYFELGIYLLILVSVAVGIIQTVDGYENSLVELEWFAVGMFTLEYLLRFIAAPADPEFAKASFSPRLRFVMSFYSILDLLAILPFYVAMSTPGDTSWADENRGYLRTLRLLRLLKLDKYMPSITLIDDVLRLKRRALIVAGFAAGTLWILFAALLFVMEQQDDVNGIDPVPAYGCDENCTMQNRFRTYLDSLVYTGVHLTGDYPIVTYTLTARCLNFFMVIAAVGVVSIPSGLIANGFAEIVQTKSKARKEAQSRRKKMLREQQEAKSGLKSRAAEEKKEENTPQIAAGDDWYEIRLAALQGKEAPPSAWGPTVDGWQIAVNNFLNGVENTATGEHTHTTLSFYARIFMLLLIVANVVAVLAESVPEIDRFVGNEPGNFFDLFEALSVFIFTSEYCARLFCAPKNRKALFSAWVYATTFFGIVDVLSTAPWFIEQILHSTGQLSASSANVFRVFRVFRILQLEDFVVAFSKLDNVFRASKEVLKATGLMALIIWVGCASLFFLFEQDNPNWRSCDDSIPFHTDEGTGCFDFASTAACNEVYPGQCHQVAFTDMPNTLFYVAVFLVGEWGLIDFTWPGRVVCLFLCVAGIALYAIPTGTLFDSFGAVLGMGEEEDDDDEEEEEAEEAEDKKKDEKASDDKKTAAAVATTTSKKKDDNVVVEVATKDDPSRKDK